MGGQAASGPHRCFTSTIFIAFVLICTLQHFTCGAAQEVSGRNPPPSSCWQQPGRRGDRPVSRGLGLGLVTWSPEVGQQQLSEQPGELSDGPAHLLTLLGTAEEAQPLPRRQRHTHARPASGPRPPHLVTCLWKSVSCLWVTVMAPADVSLGKPLRACSNQRQKVWKSSMDQSDNRGGAEGGGADGDRGRGLAERGGAEGKGEELRRGAEERGEGPRGGAEGMDRGGA